MAERVPERPTSEAERPPGVGDGAPPRLEREPPKWRRRRSLIIIGAIAAVVVSGALLYLLVTAGKESTDDAQVDADVVPLAPRVAGLVIAMGVVENQAVKRGELIVQLDDQDYRARVAQAAAELESARAQADEADAQMAVAEAAARGAFSQAQANLASSSRTVSGSEAQVDQARAVLRSRQAELTLAEVNLRRARVLQEQQAIPKQQLDQAQAQYDSSRAGLKAAQASVDAADEQLRRAQAQVGESEGRVVVSRPVEANIAAARANAAFRHARVESAQASLALANLNLEWTRIAAPQDGVVSRIMSHPGAFLSAGQTVAQFVPTNKYVTANFKETQIARMHLGLLSEVKVDTYGRTIRGKVESLSAGTGARFSLFPPDNATGNFVKVAQRIPVRIALEGSPSDMVLRAGQSVEVTVHLTE